MNSHKIDFAGHELFLIMIFKAQFMFMLYTDVSFALQYCRQKRIFQFKGYGSKRDAGTEVGFMTSCRTAYAFGPDIGAGGGGL